MKTLLPILTVLLMISGCKGITENENPRLRFIADLSVRAATAKAIEQSSNTSAAADRIAYVAKTIGDDVESGALVSVERIKPRLMSLAKVDEMKTSDRIIAESLIDLIAFEFTERVKGGLISSDAQIRLVRLAELVEVSTEPFREPSDE